MVQRYLFVLLFIIVSTSCTSLQYRLTDKEIKSNFAAENIATQFTYFKIDSLDYTIRVQTVTANSKKYNLVFLHGSPSSLSAWRSYLKNPELLSDANMHAIDRPGFGYSNFGKELTSIAAQAQIVSDIINEKELKHVILVGASYGGPVAAKVGVLNTQVAAVVLVSPALDPLNEKDIWASRLTQWWLTRWLVPTGYRVAGDEKTVHAEELASLEKDLSKLMVPVIHIHGDKDNIVPYVNTNYSKKQFQNIEIVTIPNKGHEIAWSTPELIIPELIKLIARLENEE